MKTQSVIRLSATVIATAGLALGMALPASASHGGKGVEAHGQCTVSGKWKLKAKNDDSRIEVEAEAETQQAAGLTYTWTITDNGNDAAQGTSVTRGSEGSFGVHAKIANQGGTDTIVFTATNAETGNTCSGTVTV
jgi:hypothetical protein